MLLNEGAHDVESQPGARSTRLRGEDRGEKFFTVLRWNPRSRVVDGDRDRIPLDERGQGEPSPALHRLGPVYEQGYKDLDQVPRVRLNLRNRGVLCDHLHLIEDGGELGHLDCVVEQIRDVDPDGFPLIARL